MAKTAKTNLEFLLVKAEVKGIPEKGLLKSCNIEARGNGSLVKT